MSLEPCTVCQLPGAWKCAGCGAKCHDHVKRVKGPRQRFRCDVCGADAELLRAHRSESTRFESRVKPSLILIGRPLLACLASALLLWVATFLGGVGFVLALPFVLLLSFKYFRTTADGDEYDWPAFSEVGPEVGEPLARAASALLPVAILIYGGVFASVVTPWMIEFPHVRSLAVTILLAPSFWIVTVVVLAWTPFALLHAMTAPSWVGALNPLPLVGHLRAFPRAYGFATAFAAGGFVTSFVVRWLLPAGHFGRFATTLIGCYALFALLRLLGELVHLHPDLFGWGRPDEAFVELGDPRAPGLYEPRSLPTPVPVAVHAVSLESQLIAALDAKDLELASKLYTGAPHADVEVSPATLLRFGQAAASVSDNGKALKALLAAAAANLPAAAKALVIAARILDERFRDLAGAKRLYDQVLQRFPDSQAADFAKRQLADTRFFRIKAG